MLRLVGDELHENRNIEDHGIVLANYNAFEEHLVHTQVSYHHAP